MTEGDIRIKLDILLATRKPCEWTDDTFQTEAKKIIATKRFSQAEKRLEKIFQTYKTRLQYFKMKEKGDL